MRIKLESEERQLLNYTAQKVTELFGRIHVPAHNIDHVGRVVKWAEQLVEGEKPRKPLLCLLSAWFHDVGRTAESKPGSSTREHHELSYQILQQWFREDSVFDILSKAEKLEVLYSVRYHWNNSANKYDTAWILRDADKLDGFGLVGIKRLKELYSADDSALNQAFRNQNDCYLNIRTKTAKEIIIKKKMFVSFQREVNKYLCSKIEPVEI